MEFSMRSGICLCQSTLCKLWCGYFTLGFKLSKGYTTKAIYVAYAQIYIIIHNIDFYSFS